MALQCPRCFEENDENNAVCVACGETLSFLKSVPLFLDNRYEVLLTRKAGGMGCIYKAKDTRLNNIVAVKKMLSPFTNPEEMAYIEQRFREEARLLSQLHHGGLPKVFDFFIDSDPSTDQTSYYIVMTFIEGKDFDEIISEREGPFPVEDVIDYFRQILLIMNYLHSQQPPVVYGDLKPSNIMLSEGKIFLVDFGIARIFDPRKEGSSIITGTPGYAAPEQFKGLEEPTTDIYSLAAVMHQLLTGINPQDDSQALFSFEPPRNINPKVPEYLNRIIMSCLELNPEDRPQSAQKVLEMLTSSVSEEARLTRKLILPKMKSIFEAVEKNDINEIKRFIITDRTVLAMKDDSGQTALHIASAGGLSMIADLLISSGAEINEKDHKGRTPLHWAAYKGYSVIADLLISHGAKIDAVSNEGATPLHSSADKGNIVVAELLISRGANVNAKADNGWTPLHIAACYGHKALVEFLIFRGAYIDAQNQFGWTPLHWAVDRGHKEVVDFLISKGADIEKKTFRGSTALHWAAKKGYLEIAKLLVAKGSDVNMKDDEGWTPLHWAADYGNIEVAKFLMEKGAQCIIQDNSGKSPQQLAREKQHWELERLLQPQGTVEMSKYKDIFDAIANNDKKAVEGFLNTGIPVDGKNRFGWTPVHWASDRGLKEMVEFLLKKGADINVKTFRGSTALHWVAKKGQKDMVELIISKGGKVNDADNEGWTPLHWVSNMGYPDLAEVLLSAGARINEMDNNGKTPLHIAAENGHAGVIKLLVSAGARLDIKDISGRTPYDLAMAKGHRMLAELIRVKQQSIKIEKSVPIKIEKTSKSEDSASIREVKRLYPEIKRIPPIEK